MSSLPGVRLSEPRLEDVARVAMRLRRWADAWAKDVNWGDDTAEGEAEDIQLLRTAADLLTGLGQ